MSGRLTLSWANKDKALLSHGEEGYEWVDRDDPRIAEVRLLDEVDRVGDAVGTPSDNLLIRGDSLDALTSLVKTPEYAEVYRGKVKLVYIDPPFNTGQAFEHYDDSLEHSVWLGMMRERLVLIRELLAPDGSVWVHLDDAEMAYCKVLMDEIFGRSNFVATVVWQKLYAPENRTDVSTMHDSIMVFARSREVWKMARNLLSRSQQQTAQYRNPDDDPRGEWKAENFTAKAGPGRRREQFYTIESPAGKRFDPPPGRCWVYTQERYFELLADNRIWFGSTGQNGPAIKRFLTEVADGVTPGSWWSYDDVGHNQEAKQQIVQMFPGATPFSTPKPERLLERVIHIGTNPGDIVLDCFAGSGTTAAVAHKMGRRWVTVELSDSTASTFTKPRLTKVVNGEDPGGVTKTVDWQGGGGFRELRVAEPAFPVHVTPEYSAVTLPEALDDERFARAVAAQLGFTHDTSVSPFSGRKGRSRLAVVRGVVDQLVVDDVLSALDDRETVTIAATMFTADAAPRLRERSRGSRILRVPGALFPSGVVTR